MSHHPYFPGIGSITLTHGESEKQLYLPETHGDKQELVFADVVDRGKAMLKNVSRDSKRWGKAYEDVYPVDDRC